MPVFRNFESDPVIPLLQEIRNGINNLGASFASSLGNLGDLDFNFPTFTHTELNSLELLPDIPTLLIEGETVARRNTIKNSGTSTGTVLLLQGRAEEPPPEDFLKSPWALRPGEFRIDDRDGGYPLWAMALGGAAKVEVAIEYAQAKINEIVPMRINPFFGTGANWHSSDWFLSGNDIANPIDHSLELNSTATGFKLFAFSGFTPNTPYTFTLNPGNLNYKISRALPINIYLFELDSLGRGWFHLMMNLFSSFELHQIKKMMSLAKEKSWAAGLPSAGGQFTLTPRFDRYFGLIDVAIDEEVYADTAVFNYTQTDDKTGVFDIVGY